VSFKLSGFRAFFIPADGGIDRDFMETMEIPMIEGEDLIKTFQSSGEWQIVNCFS